MKNFKALTEEKIISLVKSKEPFGGFVVDMSYRNEKLRTTLREFTKKTKKLIFIFENYKLVYFYNPFYDKCKHLDTLMYKKFCKKLTDKHFSSFFWTEDIVDNILKTLEENNEIIN